LGKLGPRSILEACCVRDWNPRAAYVRTIHVHAVVEADVVPEKVLLDFKVISGRTLNELGGQKKRWAGPPMATYEASARVRMNAVSACLRGPEAPEVRSLTRAVPCWEFSHRLVSKPIPDLNDHLQNENEETIRQMMPGYKYGSRRKDPTEKLSAASRPQSFRRADHARVA
jgi:hypothetical protein